MTRDGSEFETTSFSYTSRGFLFDFESVGELLTGNFTDGHDYAREPALGSTEHLYEFGGGAPLWSGLRNPDGRLTNIMTDNYSWSFDYDTDGKMVEYGDFELEYGGWKNIVAVHDTDTGQDFVESYIYDFAGRLVGVVSHLGHSELWLHDGRNPVERWTASNSGSSGAAHILDEYIFGQTPNQMIAARTEAAKGALVFPMSDERQSIIGIFNEDKLLVDEYAGYDPDGRIRIRDNQDTVVCSEREMHEAPCHFDDLPHFGFTGAFRSPVTGLTLMGARWYSAQIGQFITPDPLWYIDSFDLYAYAAFDPVNRWDPTGLASDGLGSIFRPKPKNLGGSKLNSFGKLDRPDKRAQFHGMRRAAGFGPDKVRGGRPGSIQLVGGGSSERDEPVVAEGWHQPLNWNFLPKKLEGFFHSAAEANRELTESRIDRHQSTTEDSGGYSIGSLYARYRLFQLRGWQLLTPQTGDEAMFDAAMAPLGGAIAGFRFLRFLPSRAAPLARRAADAPQVLGRGSTANPARGSTLPRNLREQLAVQEAMSNPTAGEVLDRITMTDPRWPADQGWVKMQMMVDPGGHGGRVDVHYVRNQNTGAIDDFKIKID